MNHLPRPEWARKKIDFKRMHETEERLKGLGLHTVCHNARCPNISECYERGTATFLILGNTCTRGCGFCNVEHGAPGPDNPGEPDLIVNAVKRMFLKYVVITSVTRDDLEDGGASVFAETIRKIREFDRDIKVEVLVPDFQGNEKAIKSVLDEKLEVFAHNVETVPSLYKIRKGARYERSLKVLEYAAKQKASKIKSALLLGLGEEYSEVINTLKDIRKTGCEYMALGQYMQPDREHYEVRKYLKPEEFEKYKEEALKIGFTHVESGTWVRSSYLADLYGSAK